jgi:hypothetical protein
MVRIVCPLPRISQMRGENSFLSHWAQSGLGSVNHAKEMLASKEKQQPGCWHVQFRGLVRGKDPHHTAFSLNSVFSV